MNTISLQNQRHFKDFANFNIDDITKNNPYEVLNCNVGNDNEAIRNAYLKLLKKYHPDNFLDENNILIIEEANKILILLNWARAECKKMNQI